ncbi:MAG: hypothetical protein ABIR66_08970 [Saprospiraceae bacterium]
MSKAPSKSSNNKLFKELILNQDGFKYLIQIGIGMSYLYGTVLTEVDFELCESIHPMKL